MSAFDLAIGTHSVQALGWAIGWAVLHSLWIGALIGLIFSVLRHSLRQHIQARYWLGIVCLLAFCVAEVAVFARPLISKNAENFAFTSNAAPLPRDVSAAIFAAKPTPSVDGVSPEGDTEKRVSPEGDTEKRVSPEGDTEKRVSPEGDTEKSVSPEGDTGKRVSPEGDTGKSVQAVTAASGHANWTFAVALVWLFGVVISAIRLVRSHHALNSLARNAHKLTPSHALFAQFKRVWQPLIESLNLPNVRFAISELIDVPCVIGSLKPMILMPAALLARLPVDQLELVLIHELSHIKNGDLWINSGQIALEVLMFYHPVVHWISADVRATRERRCDHAVLALRATPVSYAHTLLSLEEFRIEFRSELPNLALAATGGELSARVREILAVRRSKPRHRARANMRGVAVLSLAAMVALAGAIASALVLTGAKPVVSTPSAPARDSLFAVSPVQRDLSPDVDTTEIARARTAAIAPAYATVIAELKPTARLSRAQNNLHAAAESDTGKTTVVFARRVLRPSHDQSTKLPARSPPAVIDGLTSIRTAHLLSLAAQATRQRIQPEHARATHQPSRTPRVLARVQPTFAPGLKTRQMFSLSFGLDAAGKPQAIRLAAGRPSQEQLRAAQTALAQWQFDPAASEKYTGGRLTQSFSFQEISATGRCPPRVGTRICR